MKSAILVLIVAVTVTLTLTSCGSKAPATTGAPAAGQATTYSDPFAYCRTVVAVDAPDARYTGEKIPVTIVKGLQNAMGLSDDMPLELIAQGSTWRCMDGQVYACHTG